MPKIADHTIENFNLFMLDDATERAHNIALILRSVVVIYLVAGLLETAGNGTWPILGLRHQMLKLREQL